jgi:hypothetical protein
MWFQNFNHFLTSHPPSQPPSHSPFFFFRNSSRVSFSSFSSVCTFEVINLYILTLHSQSHSIIMEEHTPERLKAGRACLVCRRAKVRHEHRLTPPPFFRPAVPLPTTHLWHHMHSHTQNHMVNPLPHLSSSRPNAQDIFLAKGRSCVCR